MERVAYLKTLIVNMGNDKWDEFILFVRKAGYRTTEFETAIMTALVYHGLYAKRKDRDDLVQIFNLLSRISFVYDIVERRWIWVSHMLMSHYGMNDNAITAACLYSNLEILRMFFGVDLSINTFNGIDGFLFDSSVKSYLMQWMCGRLHRDMVKE